MDELQRLATSGHLTDVLDQAGLLAGRRVREVAVVADRATLLSRIIRVRLCYDGPAEGGPAEGGPAGHLPASLILKGGHPDYAGTEWANRQREVAFYADVAPCAPPGLVPRCFGARRGDATTPWHLVLEDLTETHKLATEAPLPPSDAVCRRMVGSLARWHALWWNDPRLGVTLGERFDEPALARFIEQIAAAFAAFADRLGDDLSAERRGFYERLMADAPGVRERYATGRDVTIGHGDAHFWNCLLPRDGQAGLRWIDWDGWRIRVPTNDLAYMLAVHLYPDRRRRSERALLDHYHACLVAHGVQGYGHADMLADYRLSVLWHTVTPVFQAWLKLPPGVWWNNYQRVMAAAEDLGCRALMG